MSGLTQYGFEWGPMEVQRLVHIEGRGYALEVRTGFCSMQMYVSEKGRKIKAYPVHPVVAAREPDRSAA